MDFEKISRHLVRYWRGKRSQHALSRRLGYKSNVLYLWESGRAWPPTTQALRLARCVGLDIARSVCDFYGREPAWLARVRRLDDRSLRELVTLLLCDLKADVSIVTLARATGFSRFAIARWLKGDAEPRLPDFLTLVQASSLRGLDFIASLADPEQLPAAAEPWRRLQASRQAAYALPWSHALLRALELRDYLDLRTHEPGWLARRIGISVAEEESCLRVLDRAGQIRYDGQHFRPAEVPMVDTRQNPAAAAKLKAWWASVAAERLGTAAAGAYAGYNVFACARDDVPRLLELQRSYFRSLRALIAESSPAEVLMLATTQLTRLDGVPCTAATRSSRTADAKP